MFAILSRLVSLPSSSESARLKKEASALSTPETPSPALPVTSVGVDVAEQLVHRPTRKEQTLQRLHLLRLLAGSWLFRSLGKFRGLGFRGLICALHLGIESSRRLRVKGMKSTFIGQ